MADNSMVSMNVDKDVVEQMIRKNISVSLLAAMGDDRQKSTILDAIVKEALNIKVDQEGKVSQYSSYNTTNYLDWKVQNIIRGAAKEALDEFASSQQNTIKREVKRALIAQAPRIADQLVASFAESAASSWRFKVDVKVDPRGGDA